MSLLRELQEMATTLADGLLAELEERLRGNTSVFVDKVATATSGAPARA